MKQILAALLLLLSACTVQAQKQFKALLLTKTAGWHHESINDGVEAIKELANRNYFDVQWHQDAIKITDKYLQDFQVLIFLNTTGDILDSAEQKAIERFIQSGKGYVASIALRIRNTTGTGTTAWWEECFIYTPLYKQPDCN